MGGVAAGSRGVVSPPTCGTRKSSAESLRCAPTARGEQLLHIIVQRSRGGLVVKADKLVYHSTPGLGVIKKKKKELGVL